MTRKTFCVAWSRHHSSGRMTAEIPGRWSQASATMSTLESGSRETEGSACTRSCATGIACTLASRLGGHYLSEDGGQTFKAANQGVGAGFTPDPYPEFGQCVHKIAGHPATPGRLYMQNHGGWADWSGPGGPRPGIGVLRSDDHGKTWRSIAKGLPSDFGFPIVVHPHNADTVYVVPLEPMTRTCPGGAPAVWRSENGGGSWKRLARGMAKKESYFTVLRDAMDIDDLRSPALYFGTTTGQLWIGRDGGEEWSCLFESLPPIHCVKVAVV